MDSTVHGVCTRCTRISPKVMADDKKSRIDCERRGSGRIAGSASKCVGRGCESIKEDVVDNMVVSRH